MEKECFIEDQDSFCEENSFLRKLNKYMPEVDMCCNY